MSYSEIKSQLHGLPKTKSMNAVPLKQWCAEEAQRANVARITIYHRIQRGWYPKLPLKRVNKRVVFVEVDKMNDWMGMGAFTEGTA